MQLISPAFCLLQRISYNQCHCDLPVVEVVNVDHEGEVGEGSQHEGRDEAGGDVVAWLTHKVDDDLMIFYIFNVFITKKSATYLFGVSVASSINDGVVVDLKLHNGLCALVYYEPGLDQDLTI